MSTTITADEWEVRLGLQIRALRFKKNLSQRDLSAKADVALNVIKRLEHGEGVNVNSLIKVLVALDRVDWISTLGLSAANIF